MTISIRDLINELDGKIEDRSFDLKRTVPSVGEIVKEIQGGMNGVEPKYRVVVGIDEGADKRFDWNNVTPITWPAGSGALATADTYRTAIDGSLKASTSDYHEGYWTFTEFAVPGGSVLVIEALRSPFGPHQNMQDGRYYIRRAGSTSHMTAAEIRRAVAGESEARIDPDDPRPPIPEGEFLADLRQHHAVPGANELRYAGGAQFHIRLLPTELKEHRFSPTHLKHHVRGLYPLGPWRSGSNERVEDGYLAWRVEQSDLEKTGAFSKIFETGEVWGVDNARLAGIKGGPASIPGIIVPEARNAIRSYASTLQGLGVSPPYRVQITLHDVRSAPLHVSSRGNDGICLKQCIHFHRFWDPGIDKNADDLCNEFAKQLWDECGLVLSYRIQFQDA